MDLTTSRARLFEEFEHRFGAGVAPRVALAPGRVNLIGEHTDYNEGFVLPAAISLEIRIAYLPTSDRRVELVRLDDGDRDGFDLDGPRPKAGTWLDYVAGTAWAQKNSKSLATPSDTFCSPRARAAYCIRMREAARFTYTSAGHRPALWR